MFPVVWMVWFVATSFNVVADVDRVFIEVGRSVVRPTAIGAPGVTTVDSGELRVAFEESLIRFQIKGDEIIHRTTGKVCKWIGRRDDLAFVQIGERIWRFDLERRRGGYLQIGTDEQRFSRVICQLGRNGSVAVLADVADDSGTEPGAVLSVFSGELEPDWRRSLKSPAVGMQMPPIAWSADRLLVCAGSDLLCLSARDGKTLWRINRVWEFQESVTLGGRSQSILHRASENPLAFSDEPSECAVNGTGRIIGLCVRDGQSADSPAFVAVSRTEPRGNGLWQTIARIVEVSPDGTAVSVVQLPRNGLSSCEPIGSGAVWAGPGGVMLRVEQTGTTVRAVGEFDEPAVGTRLRWYVEHTARTGSPWLTNECPPLCEYSGETAIRFLGNCVVAGAGDSIVRFPLLLVDLETGMSRQVDLCVPFRGQLSSNVPNVARTGDRFRLRDGVPLRISGLVIKEDAMEFLVTDDQKTTQITFSIRSIRESTVN